MSEENAALGDRIVEILGPGAAGDMLDAITRSDEDRARLIGRLSTREDARWLAEVLIDLEETTANRRGCTRRGAALRSVLR